MYRAQSEDSMSVERMLLTEKQAADLLNLSPRTLYDLRQLGKIAYVRFGVRGIRYRPADLEAWINSARKEAV